MGVSGVDFITFEWGNILMIACKTPICSVFTERMCIMVGCSKLADQYTWLLHVYASYLHSHPKNGHGQLLS